MVCISVYNTIIFAICTLFFVVVTAAIAVVGFVVVVDVGGGSVVVGGGGGVVVVVLHGNVYFQIRMSVIIRTVGVFIFAIILEGIIRVTVGTASSWTGTRKIV